MGGVGGGWSPELYTVLSLTPPRCHVVETWHGAPGRHGETTPSNIPSRPARASGHRTPQAFQVAFVTASPSTPPSRHFAHSVPLLPLTTASACPPPPCHPPSLAPHLSSSGESIFPQLLGLPGSLPHSSIPTLICQSWGGVFTVCEPRLAGRLLRFPEPLAGYQNTSTRDEHATVPS